MTRKTALPPETAGAATDARRAVRGGGGAGAPAGSLQMPPRIVRGARLRRYWMALALWGACVLYFWVWWLSPAHILSPVRYWLLTLLLFWITFLQAYFLYFALNARRVTSTLSDLGPFRAAMVVTKTPVEPFSVLRPTLEAMLAQSVPHDTWLADEDPDQETRDWCQQNGVRISSRKGVESYHRSEWPRRTRCKEGNLAYFYDQYGYEAYDFVAQLDADHVPQAGYLEAMLVPFADPRVGYVSAPSICSKNASKSWAARARLHSEAMFHGAMQAGYTAGWASMCIGSHYAVRTEALKQVGGLGPELAEDHSTTMILNAGGWRGAHAIDAIALGDGPGTFADMITQEFQWSRSLMSLLLRYTSNYYADLPHALKFQFVFSQMWYPLFALFMALTFTLPILALIFDMRWADVTYPAFLLHALPTGIALIVIAAMFRRDRLFRPFDARVLSWEKLLFPIAQWPWVLWGCSVAVFDRLSGRFVDFRITPKGQTDGAVLPWRAVLPTFGLAVISLGVVIGIDDVTDAAGFYVLAFANAALYSALFLVIVVKHLQEQQIKLSAVSVKAVAQILAVFVLVSLGSQAVALRGAQGVYAITAGMGPVRVVKPMFYVSGAGQAAPGQLRYEFYLPWWSE